MGGVGHHRLNSNNNRVDLRPGDVNKPNHNVTDGMWLSFRDYRLDVILILVPIILFYKDG